MKQRKVFKVMIYLMLFAMVASTLLSIFAPFMQ
ncbi:stressosome-associated protein Prli42 [Paenibacillus sediminis]|uniref:DUF4044 domain-containing protein n=1 Tax=Paenibacillus sediminis TaxID=664909 RepID=A0ABS4GZJ4_9BACL|nr:stressosome-associated protein Prli42 [Paenibacillus sediminis]MBP1935689.1 hypothetical protein [Paenibacillus sediminis]